MTIRIMTEQDLDGVTGLEQACFPTPYSREMFAKELINPISRYFVALEGETLLGYAGIWKIVDEAEVISIAVSPAHRRQGVGRALMQALAEDCIRSGMKAIRLEVRQGNLPAQTLYTSMGFTPYGIRKKYYENREDAVLMIKAVEE